MDPNRGVFPDYQLQAMYGAIQVPLVASMAGMAVGAELAPMVGRGIMGGFALGFARENMRNGDVFMAAVTLLGGTLDLGEGLSIVGSGRAYSVAYRTTLEPVDYLGASRDYQFQQANRALAGDMDADPAFAARMEKVIPNLREQLGGIDGRAFSRDAPANWTWHHGVKPGTFELIPSAQHWNKGLWSVLHPKDLAGKNRGGQSRWGHFVQRP
jgi:hypothetical protein